MPIIVWLPQYKWREDFIPDLLAGITTAFIHVPQGLAFAMLAQVTPIFGLYTACFSTLVYCFFGTAQVGSFGPVAVASMLIGEAVAVNSGTDGYMNNEIASALTLNIGAIYVIAFLLRLGVLASVFIKPFTSGFVTGCAVHIVVKVLRPMLGLHMKPVYGFLNLFYNYHNVATALGHILAVNTGIFRPFLKRYTRFILPIEVVVMAISIALSHWLDFAGMGIAVVGTVPTGLPAVILPSLGASSFLWGPAVVVAAINYSTTTSMTLMFNRKLDPNQELLALGVSNLLCCNLSCISIGNSMMRTVIAVSVGTRTLISSIVSCIILFFVILFMGPVFSPLPDCVLGAILMIGVVMLIIGQLKDVPKFFKTSIEDTFIWGATLGAVLLANIDYGLIVGIVLSLRKILGERDVSIQQQKKKDEEGDVAATNDEKEERLPLNHAPSSNKELV
ncbi:hypothetical protein AAG570_000759 [Ranatra chinensis]|uniref:SLC26A/SulP transporter domain-containing protein n=1 Tax=Ranatra chinensis TaxID=642074 RepID=A0ABD0YY02_9HEMI